MSDQKPTLLIAESAAFNTTALAALRRCFEVELADLTRVELLHRVSACQYLWVRLRNLIDTEVLDAAPKLKAIITNTTGLNHIDVEAAQRRGIQIFSLQGEVEFLKEIRATAEHTLALTLALLRHIPAAHAHVCAGGWNREPFQGREIHQKTVGIVGYGRLGSIVARYFQSLGASVVICDPKLMTGSLVDTFPTLSLGDLLQRSDIVSLHVNFQPQNYHLFTRDRLSQMKPGAVLINTARGELIDEEALVSLVASGHLAGVALDVIDQEHTPKSSFENLRALARRGANILLTPHIGGNTLESLARTEWFLAQRLCEHSSSDSFMPVRAQG